MKRQSVKRRARMAAYVVALLFGACGAQTAKAQLTVVSVSPAARSLTTPVGSSIAVTFDQPVNPATVDSLSFWAFGRWSGTATGTISLANGDTTIVLTPDEPFFAGEQVSVYLSHDLAGAGGAALRSGGYSFQFWTAAGRANMVFAENDRLSTRTSPTVTSRAYGGIATDLNGDGFSDITVVNEDTADLRVFLNRADDTGLLNPFIQPTFPVNHRASPSEPSDFNRDGHADICVANIDTNSVSILMGNGDGTFGPQQEVGVGAAPRGIAVLDFDGDGDIDIVNTNMTSDNMTLLRNNGNGVFNLQASFDSLGSGEWALNAADMNEDGLLDLVIGARTGQQMLVHTGNGNGTFSIASIQSTGGSVWMIACGDVNGDGHEDVSAVNSTSNNGAILLGDGAGNLAAPTTYATDSFPLATDVGDLDGDGDLDWVTSSFGGDWRVFRNDGSGVFSFDQEVPSPTAASCCVITDLNNDGDLDLALIDEIDDLILLMDNVGTPVVPATSTWGLAILLLAIATAATVLLRRWNAGCR